MLKPLRDSDPAEFSKVLGEESQIEPVPKEGESRLEQISHRGGRRHEEADQQRIQPVSQSR